MNERIIVSLTSIKNREAALKETVASLLAQDIDVPFEVRIHLSREPYLIDSGFGAEPSWIASLRERNPRCMLSVRFVPNTGPYRKLLPVLEECFGDPLGTVIVTCDDDTQYSQTWLTTLLLHHRCTGGLVAFRGHTARLSPEAPELLPYTNWQQNPHKSHHSLANLPTGKDGVVYRPCYFNRAVLDVNMAMRLAPTADDLWFRWHSILKGVPCYLIDLQDRVFADVPSFEKEVSLWEVYNKKGGNDTTVERLERHFMRAFGTNVAFRLSEYRQTMRLPSLPSLDHNYSTPATIAARQVRVINALQPSPLALRAVVARSYELLRLRRQQEACSTVTPLPTEPRSDRGGLLYAIETVNRFDLAYGWMASATEAAADNLISVVMTTCNAAGTVRWAVRSVLSQDHPRIELIIVDDHSTDTTRNLLRELRREDDRIRLFFLPKNRGTYFAKNVGIVRAKGAFVTFQDADDWSHPARLRLQLWRLLKTRCVATRCNYVRHHARANQLVKVNGRIESPGFITLMTRREIFEQDGYFDCSRRAADDELICRLKVLHGEEAVDTFALPAYVALYSDQSLIADSSEYTAKEGLRFILGQDRERYKNVYTSFHERLRQEPKLRGLYTFPPHSIFIEKPQTLNAFDEHEIPGLIEEIRVEEVGT